LFRPDILQHEYTSSSKKLFSFTCSISIDLLVWNDRYQRIEPFYKIRNHVKRAGRFLGNARDSPADLCEHLMIIFYDILLLDDIICICETHDKRRQRLQSLVHCIPGRADIGNWEVVDFSSLAAPGRLRQAFSQAITQWWEGFVLKGCRNPYISFHSQNRYIKLKKDYIVGLGNTADFAVVGGFRDAKDEQELGIGKLWWTLFYNSCLDNKEAVRRFGAKPKFCLIDSVDRHGISKQNILFLNRRGYFKRVPFTTSRPELDVSFGQLQLSRPSEIFKSPFIVEVTGAGFDKLPNTSYFTLRFPRIQKIHQDRAFKDIVGYDELQELAKRAMEPLPSCESQEQRYWIEKLHARSRHSHPVPRAMGGALDDNTSVQKDIVTPSKRKLSAGNPPLLASAAKRAKVSATGSIDGKAI
jgi:DNA ligase 4